MTLSAFVRANLPRVLARWLSEARRLESARGIAEEDLIDNLPELLCCLGDGGDLRGGILDAHLAERLDRGFALRDVVREFVLLGRALHTVRAELEAQERPSDEEMTEVLERIGVCIDHALRLFGRDIDEVEHDRLLSRKVGSLVHADDDLPLVDLDLVPDLVCETLGAQGAALYVFDPNSGTLVVRAQRGTSRAVGARLPLDSDDVVARAARHRELFQQEDAGDRRSLHAAVRLEHEAQLLGVICVALEGPVLSRKDCLRLRLLAERVAVLLEVVVRFNHLGERNAALAVERQAHGRFLALVAHDLRGPLYVAKLASRHLARGMQLDPTSTRLLATLGRSIDRVDRMVRDLLDADRVRSGALLPLSISRFDLAALVREVVERDLAFAHGRIFDLDLPDEPVMGSWSADELSRSIWNLAANAVKYGRRGGRVGLSLKTGPGSVALAVHNDGAPIPPSMMERIFVPFSRLDERGSGWGLGLTLVRASAEAHGGTVAVSSSEELGTTFTLRLPRETSAVAQPAPAEGALSREG